MRTPQVARIHRRHAGRRLRGGAQSGGAHRGSGTLGLAADMTVMRSANVNFDSHDYAQVLPEPDYLPLMDPSGLPQLARSVWMPGQQWRHWAVAAPI